MRIAFVFFLLAGCSMIAPVKTENVTETLRSLAEKNGIYVGAAVNVEALGKDERYSKILAKEFSLITPENSMKFNVIHPDRGRYDFSQADALVDFAERYGMKVNGHVLVWDQQLPDWLTKNHFTKEELKAILHDHIRSVVSRYRGKVWSWDVAAEAVGGDGKLRDTFWSRGIGADYLELAFRWVHEADPEAHLRYNDYGGEDMGPKSQGIYDLVARLRRKGVPIDGVGLQMHVEPGNVPNEQEVRRNMERLAAIGLDSHITEMDVSLPMPATADDFRAQARVYLNMLQACLLASRCRSFSTWGVTDRYSWIPESFPGLGDALLFDQDYQPKSAYFSICSLLRDNAASKGQRVFRTFSRHYS
jgi:endo-1,4-beta-xylanase